MMCDNCTVAAEWIVDNDREDNSYLCMGHAAQALAEAKEIFLTISITRGLDGWRGVVYCGDPGVEAQSIAASPIGTAASHATRLEGEITRMRRVPG